MTVRLEELLAAAVGDDPWYHPNYGAIRTKHPDDVIRLIALAPDAVRLLIDMGEYVRRMEKHWGGEMAGSALLARLDRLGNTT